MIQFLSVTKKYTKDIVAVEDISFDVNEGEFVFLVGPSGSGKTTLIKLLIREELPSVGKIFFNDQDITRYKRGQVYQLRRKIGVIFQDFKLIPELNAFENVAFAMEVAGRSEKEIQEHVPYLLDIVGLSHRMHFFPRQLSGGEKQRVAIARAIANNPKVLIADEPTGNLDPQAAWDIVQILAKINNWGTTVIMSTHGSDIVNTLHKRVIKMENGKMIRDVMKGTYEELDDFSLKVINSAQESSTQPLVKGGEDIIVVQDVSNFQNASSEMINEGNTPEAAVTEEPVATKLRQESKSKQKKTPKLKISTKKKKAAKPAANDSVKSNTVSTSEAEIAKIADTSELEEKVLNQIDAEISAMNTSNESDSLPGNPKIADLKISSKSKEILTEAGYNDLSDLSNAGKAKLQKLKDIKKIDLDRINKLINIPNSE